MIKTVNRLIIAMAVMITSCEKVINIDLNTTDPKLVVEANITNLPGHYTVSLTHTVNYYDPNVFPTVSGASIVIYDNAGNSETLTEFSPGNYRTNLLQGVEGRAYSVKILSSGNEYHATSTMPFHVSIDSLNLERNDRGNGYRLICKFLDPQGISNFYKLQISSNDIAAFDSTSIRIVADGFADGQELSLTYRTRLVPGDSVTAMLECIDKPVYDFYRTLTNVEGGVRSFLSAPPSNPITNINNGGFGYFSAHSVSLKTVVVQ